MKSTIRLGDVAIRVALKDIKNVHLSVHPPSGRVTISAPQRLSLDTVRAFAITRLGWIREQQRKFREQERETKRDYVERESHYLWGRRYLLKVVEKDEPPAIRLTGNRLVLQVRPATPKARRRELFEEWYRSQLREALADLVAKWQERVGVSLAGIHVQRMRTKWGSCNPPRRTIRLNTDLARKPRQCLEFILVHELIHFQTRRHDDKFIALMNAHLPNWRHLRHQLNSMPLAHEDWDY
jgi:predicted metal-dependent hydrolase